MTTPAWFDSHCHIQDAYRPEDRTPGEVLDEAAAAGVRGVVCVGTDAGSSRQALELAAGRREGDGAVGVWATVGLHPHEASTGLGDVEALLRASLPGRRDAVVAVGECGLDYHYDHSPRPAQREVFAAQIALAAELGLALVVHTREAWPDTVAMLAEAALERVVLHCFTGGPDEARACLDLGAYLSFSGIVSFAGAQEVRDAAALCPLDRLLVETDAPFLAPVPYRGRSNRPAWVAEVGAAVAAAKAVEPESVAAASMLAARRVFGIS
ncbi:MAG: TatD family hydrolase [Acidobacteriota bacterium]|nr:TatD family hydrolase [Acidobacteriota bacterium]